MTSIRRDAVVLVIATIAARAVFLRILPEGAYSIDLWHWAYVEELLRRGINPYAVTSHLNWPPFWMQVLYVLGAVGRATGFAVVDMVRWFLIAIDTVNIVLALFIAVRYLGIANARNILLAGMALNPISLFLTCQHANFDALVVTALLSFALAMLRWRESSDAVDWLLAAFALGIGVLIKTMPLILAPLLAYRTSSLPSRVRAFGGALLVVPAGIGMSVIYVLAPDAVMANVIRYHSYAGWWGISGLLYLAGWGNIAEAYAGLFTLVLIVGLVLLGRWVARTAGLENRELILLMAIVVLGLIVAGPGYGAQYIAWPLPFFVLAFPLFDNQWRRDLLTVWGAAAITYAIEYAFMVPQGAFLLKITSDPTVHYLSRVLAEQGPSTLLRLPLFAGHTWLIVSGVKLIRRQRYG